VTGTMRTTRGQAAGLVTVTIDKRKETDGGGRTGGIWGGEKGDARKAEGIGNCNSMVLS